ncbi:MFS transporter [Rhizobium azibense]|uniref:Putative MFS family arabinose efflux permease n=1 Tax=Rhizobium azibense TaxID=1136135 RepID=A0A4R3RXZ1_9HYPH|nr:MFS transporter [Rhizobium azibense]TCU41153.1 putative MFS family arabinose efflux permease [Rhizobium azibense]
MTGTIAVVRGFGPVFAILFGLQFISMGAMEMSGPFWPLRIEELSSSGGIFALAGIGVYVCPMVGVSLTSALWGRMGDRYGNRLMMVRALAGLALTQILVSFAQDVWMILLLRFLQGCCAGYIAPAQAYGIQITGGRNRGVLLTWLQVATNVGSLGGAFLGGLILDASSFATINLTAGFICAVCAAAAWAILPRPAAETSGDGGGQVRQNQAFKGKATAPVWGLLALTGMMLASRMVLQVPFALYMAEVFRAPHWVTGFSYGLLALGFVVAAPLWAQFFNDRPASYILGWMILIAGGCALLTILAGLTRSVEYFSLIYLFWGGLLGGTTPILVALMSAATADGRQGSVLGTAQSWQQIASVAGIATGAGTTQIFGLTSVFPLASLLYAASLFTAVGLWFLARSRLPIGDSL